MIIVSALAWAWYLGCLTRCTSRRCSTVEMVVGRGQVEVLDEYGSVECSHESRTGRLWIVYAARGPSAQWRRQGVEAKNDVYEEQGRGGQRVQSEGGFHVLVELATTPSIGDAARQGSANSRAEEKPSDGQADQRELR
jgi:hypothetical protein